MRDCQMCGANKWKWDCQSGLMQGTCSECGAKTNKFKANGKRKNNKEITKE
jgi:hypothetical protein